MKYPSNQRVLIAGEKKSDSHPYSVLLPRYMKNPKITVKEKATMAIKAYEAALDEANCFDLVVATNGTSKEIVNHVIKSGCNSRLILEKSINSRDLDKSGIVFTISNDFDTLDETLTRVYKKNN